MAWAFERAEGWEHNVASAAGTGIANSITNAAISTLAARTGTYGLRCSPTAAAAGQWEMLISLSTYRNLAVKFHFKVPTLPASDLKVASFYAGSGVQTCLMLTSTGAFKVLSPTTGGSQTGALTFNAGDSVAVEMRCFIPATGGARVFHWRFNGTDETDYTSTDTNTTAWARFRLGTDLTTGPAATLDYDDLVMWGSTSSTDEAAYPTDSDQNLRVQMHSLVSDGSHSIGTGTYTDSTGATINNATTTAWTFIDDPAGGTDFVRKTAGTEVIGTSNLKFLFESVSAVGETGSTPKAGASTIVALAESASQAEVCIVDLTIAGVTDTVFSADIGSSTVVYKAGALDNSSWAASDVDGAVLRYGSTDPSPEPRLHGVFMQIPYLPAAVVSPVDFGEIIALQAVQSSIR